ncbi:MAG TPA: cation diffusion facilitator family transporter [Pelolinea sp.]|nr:cation diffusion facilitator family transporter [Pelolinea sp.]
MHWIRDFQPNSNVSRQFRQALIITLIGNLFLAGIKSGAAYLSGSTALYADAINSISDVLYSILLVIGLWLSQRPPDISHPQGHSRFEPFVALVVTASMTYAGFEALRASIERFISGGASIELGWALLALLISVILKALMYYFVRNIGRRLFSPGLKAAAKDNLSDVVTSITAFLGILGSNFINPLLDPVAGIIVALWIFRTVVFTARENLGYLTGAGADEELRTLLFDTVKSINGVEDIHHIITEYAGPKLIVEMHINVDGEKTLNQSHTICDQATEKLEKLPEVDRAYVHVEPLGHI